MNSSHQPSRRTILKSAAAGAIAAAASIAHKAVVTLRIEISPARSTS